MHQFNSHQKWKIAVVVGTLMILIPCSIGNEQMSMKINEWVINIFQEIFTQLYL